MLTGNRSQSLPFPRPKIYLSHLNQLIDKRIVVQPEVEVNNKLFPQRNFARKLATSHQRIKSSIQLRSQKFDLHWTSKKTKPLLIENHREPRQQINELKLELPRTKSTQLANESPIFKDESVRFYSTFTGLPQNSSPESHQPAESLAPLQKNFLRRGSNIQKQIVVNLLRNKLLRERELNEKKQYSNNEIIKMIQVFKGVALQEGRKKGLIVQSSRDKWQPQGQKREPYREIKGWQHEPLHDFQLQQEKD